jgi:hypothetical protein
LAVLDGIKVWLARPAPEVGTPVLELMPANAALRQVRFKGAWEGIERKVAPLRTESSGSELPYRLSKGTSTSLWLTQDVKVPERGVLVAAHAQRSWLSPWNRAVAYLTDGALFVRELRGNGCPETPRPCFSRKRKMREG